MLAADAGPAEPVPRPELVTVEAENVVIVSPRVTRASLPPIALENGALECPACGGCFPDWERYYGHVIAPDNRICAWVRIDLIDVVPPKAGAAAADS